MKVEARIAAMSHLSDAEDMMLLGVNPRETRRHIEFVKKLILQYPDLSQQVDNGELDNIWQSLEN